MATVETKPMTADEFYDFVHRPENEGRFFELERGEVVEMPSPGELHGLVCGVLVYILNSYVFKRRQGSVCCNDTGFVVETDPDTVRGPDILVFTEARRMQDASIRYVTRIPALVVEVLSPNDKPGKVSRRVNQYLRRGAPLVWVVDPEARYVTVYRPGREHQTYDETEDLAGDDALPDFRCRVADFFRLPGEAEA